MISLCFTGHHLIHFLSWLMRKHKRSITVWHTQDFLDEFVWYRIDGRTFTCPKNGCTDRAGNPRGLETQFSRVSSADWEALLKVTRRQRRTVGRSWFWWDLGVRELTVGELAECTRLDWNGSARRPSHAWVLMVRDRGVLSCGTHGLMNRGPDLSPCSPHTLPRSKKQQPSDASRAGQTILPR